MPGSMTSMPYLVVPFVLPGMSSCGTETPIMVYWSGVFSLIALRSSAEKVLVILPLLTMSANVIDLLRLRIVIVEALTISWPAGMPPSSPPLLRQGDTPRSTCAAHRIEVHHGAPAAAGDLRAEHGIVELRIVGSELNPHILPIRAEFFADDLRHGRGDVLAHVGLADGDRDNSVRPIEYHSSDRNWRAGGKSVARPGSAA